MRRSLLASSLTAAAGGAVIVACIPDPKGEYQDYQDRTADLVGDGGGGGGEVIDAKPPEEAVEQLYVAVCVTSLSGRNPEQALRFYTETKFVPEGGGGKLTLTMSPLVGWNDPPTDAYIPPAEITVAKSETRGDPLSAEMTVGADGRFTQNLGKIDLDRAANSVSGRAAVIENVTLDGVFGSDERFCAQLSGSLTVPYNATLNPALNTCIFLKATEGQKVPALTQGEFTCAISGG